MKKAFVFLFLAFNSLAIFLRFIRLFNDYFRTAVA